MRRRLLSVSARILGGLLIVFAIWLLHPSWLLGQMIFYLFVGQAVALYAFIGFQASIGPMPAVAPVSDAEASQDDNSGLEQPRVQREGEVACEAKSKTHPPGSMTAA